MLSNVHVIPVNTRLEGHLVELNSIKINKTWLFLSQDTVGSFPRKNSEELGVAFEIFDLSQNDFENLFVVVVERKVDVEKWLFPVILLELRYGFNLFLERGFLPDLLLEGVQLVVRSHSLPPFLDLNPDLLVSHVPLSLGLGFVPS